MAAKYVIEDHNELLNSGQISHSNLDAYLGSGSLLVVSASAASPSARVLVAGPGITFVDNGPGSTFVISASISGQATNFSWNEIPLSGSADGTNRIFLFQHIPSPSNAFMLFLNGVKQREGISNDFILSGSTVIFALDNTPRSGANVDATYQY